MQEKMEAIMYSEYGSPDVLQLEEVKKPYPKSNEILVRVRAVTVNYGDKIARNFKNISRGDFNMPSIFWIMARFSIGYSQPKRKILGNTFAGVVEMVGSEVKGFSNGDQVFGYTGEKMGAYVEYLCIAEDGIVAIKPSNMTFEEASAVPYGAVMALNFLRKAHIQKGQHVLVIGASGAIGSAALQIAKNHFGAIVTGVCSMEGLEFVKDLGADHVLDYGFETKKVLEWINNIHQKCYPYSPSYNMFLKYIYGKALQERHMLLMPGWYGIPLIIYCEDYRN